jgi:stage V sporulation protein R
MTEMAVSMTSHRFPTHLKLLKYEIEEHARNYGLDFYDVIFEVLDYGEMNEVAAYGGFPSRYPHWRFGMEYEELSKGYSYGLQKIYEMVINNDPCYAYLLRSNNIVDQKIVMAHVYAHCDFFKNNVWFSKTNRKMVDEMANHGTRIQNYIERYGEGVVEEFLDTCLSIEDLIDSYSVFIQRRRPVEQGPLKQEEEEQTVQKMKSKGYMDSYINPRAFIEAEQKKIEAEKEKAKQFPEEPERDVMLFLIEHAPLENWQRDVLSFIREEAYYFSPQGQTKVMNEGWAVFFHSKIMTEKMLDPSEVIDYADHHSGTLGVRPGRINPYKLGVELFRDIEDRWNKGKFGPDYDACDDLEEKQRWDSKLGLGRQKIFEVRSIYNDIGFIDTFLTEEFCREHHMFTYRYNEQNNRYEIDGREFQKIKQKLLFSLTNFGRPFIYVVEANHRNRGELYLLHKHEGVDLRMDYAKDTLARLHRLWGRPVHIETVVNDRGVVLSFDGTEHTAKERGGV